MNKYVSFSRPDKLYKYIYIFIITRILYEYFFGSNIPEVIKIFTFPKNILVQETFNYLGSMIISFFLFVYEEKLNKNDKEKLQKINPDNHENDSSSKSTLKIKYIYKSPKIISNKLFLFVILLFFLLFLSIQLKNNFYNYYWMFEIFFVCFITHKIFETPVYIHKKIAVGFIIIFCLSLKILSTYDIFKNTNEKKYIKIIFG